MDTNNEASLTETQTPPKKRIKWLDVAKGYAMICVMLGHLEPGFIEPFLYSFHLPLFFFLSGYVFSTKRNFKDFFLRKCQELLIPYFSVGIIIIAFQRIHGHISGQSPFTLEHLLLNLKDLFVQIRAWDLWYLSCLFLVNIIFYLLVKILKNDYLLLMVSIALVVAGLFYYRDKGAGLYWNADVCFFAIFFFFMGYWSRVGLPQKLIKAFEIKWLSVVLFIVFWAGNIFLNTTSMKLTGAHLEMYMGSYAIPYMTIPAAVLGIYGVIILSGWATPKPIMYIGQNTLVYYLFHQNVALYLGRDVLRILEIDEASLTGPDFWICKISLLIFMLLFTTLLSLLFNKTKLKYLLGKF